MFDLDPVPTVIPYSNDRRSIKFYWEFSQNSDANTLKTKQFTSHNLTKYHKLFNIEIHLI
jgi:hypothetical protein